MSDDLVYRRVFDAPPELVWRCLTEPAELAHFWGPRGMSTPVEGIVVELHVGGTFQTTMIGDHGRHQMLATFTEVRAPERLAWVEPASGMVTVTTLTELGDGRTEIFIHQQQVPEQMRTPDARAGFLSSLNKFAEHLAQLLEGDTW